MISVKDFGAVGDGVADDTAAFQGAIDATADGTVIEVPAGRYRVADSFMTAKEPCALIYRAGPAPSDFPYIHVRPEGGILRNGLNIYPWSERRAHIGFILQFGRWRWRWRYSFLARRVFSSWGRH